MCRKFPSVPVCHLLISTSCDLHDKKPMPAHATKNESSLSNPCMAQIKV